MGTISPCDVKLVSSDIEKYHGVIEQRVLIPGLTGLVAELFLD